MKYTFSLSFLLALLLSTSIYGQLRIGPKGGINLASSTNIESNAEAFYEDVDPSKAQLLAYQFGAALQIGGGIFSFQPELLYTVKGSELEVSDTTFLNKDNYFEVPLLAKLSFGASKLKIFVEAGPYISYWASRDEVVEYNSETEQEDFDFDDPSFEFNRIDFGLNFGGGVALDAGPGDLVLDVRYGLGLTDKITLKDKTVGIDFQPSQNRLIAISLGYFFKLGL